MASLGIQPSGAFFETEKNSTTSGPVSSLSSRYVKHPTRKRITQMLAFIPLLFPLVPLVVGAGAGAVAVAAIKSDGGKKKAKIAALKARIEALERKP
jgi:hypothetical protein